MADPSQPMTDSIQSYPQSFAFLSEEPSLAKRFDQARKALNHHYPFLSRIAAVLYDPDSDLLKTFIHSSDDNPLQWYAAPLTHSPSLVAIKVSRRPRIVNDLSRLAGAKTHTTAIRRGGYLASYTLPVYHQQHFIGFLFLNSSEKNVFQGGQLQLFDAVANLLGQAMVQQISEVRTLAGAVQTIQEISQKRDNETGGHLKRMAAYARLIALELAPQWQLSDEFIEYLYLFAPLHDVGKIAIPDQILLKPGPLNDAEYAIMKTHTEEGRKIIEGMLHHLNLSHIEHTEMLISVVEDHHEKHNGSGYSRGLQGEHIPLAARIVAVADIFDALTSRRPYKEAWGNLRAIAQLQQLAGSLLDEECVAALCRNLEQITAIQQQFSEEPLTR